ADAGRCGAGGGGRAQPIVARGVPRADAVRRDGLARHARRRRVRRDRDPPDRRRRVARAADRGAAAAGRKRRGSLSAARRHDRGGGRRRCRAELLAALADAGSEPEIVMLPAPGGDAASRLAGLLTVSRLVAGACGKARITLVTRDAQETGAALTALL